MPLSPETGLATVRSLGEGEMAGRAGNGGRGAGAAGAGGGSSVA